MLLRALRTKKHEEGQDEDQDTPEDYLSVEAKSNSSYEDIAVFVLNYVGVKIHGLMDPNHEYDLDKVD